MNIAGFRARCCVVWKQELFCPMHKLAPVEDAKTLFNEAKDWSVWRWLIEKKHARITADAAWEALEACEEKVKAGWNEEWQQAYRELSANGRPKARRQRSLDPELKAALERLHEADEEAREGDLRTALRATVSGDRLTLDFTGTDDQHQGNLNCPLAVTRSACYFAIRVLTDPDIPANAGAYRPLEVVAPEGSLLNARSPAAVVGGNVETSSRVADVVLAAL